MGGGANILSSYDVITLVVNLSVALGPGQTITQLETATDAFKGHNPIIILLRVSILPRI